MPLLNSFPSSFAAGSHLAASGYGFASTDNRLIFGSVFWDLESCPLRRTDIRDFHIIRKIKDLGWARSFSVTSITAIANLANLSSETKLDLEDSGVALQHVSSSKRGDIELAIITEIVKVVTNFRPPHWIVLISGNRVDFGKILSFLGGASYRVLLIHHGQLSESLLHCVDEHMSWADLKGTRRPVSTLDEKDWPLLGSPPPAKPAASKSNPPIAQKATEKVKKGNGKNIEENHKADSSPTLCVSTSSDESNNIPPERFLPLLKNFSKLSNASNTSTVPTSLLSEAAQKCLPDSSPTAVLELAKSLQLIRLHPISDTASLTSQGANLISENKRRRRQKQIAKAAGNHVSNTIDWIDSPYHPPAEFPAPDEELKAAMAERGLIRITSASSSDTDEKNPKTPRISEDSPTSTSPTIVTESESTSPISSLECNEAARESQTEEFEEDDFDVVDGWLVRRTASGFQIVDSGSPSKAPGAEKIEADRATSWLSSLLGSWI